MMHLVLEHKIMLGVLKMPWNIRCTISRAMFFIGVLVFFASFPLSQYIADHFGVGSSFYKINAGYMFGYIWGFAVYLIFQIAKGRISYFVGGNGIEKFLSYFVLSILIIFGIISFLVKIFGHNTGPFFNLSFTVGAAMIVFTKMVHVCVARNGGSKKL